MSTRIKDMPRYNYKTGAYNKLLRELLQWIGEREKVSGPDICEQLGYNPAWVSRSTQLLTKLGFLKMIGKQSVRPGIFANVYTPLPIETDRLNKLLPTSKEMLDAAWATELDEVEEPMRARPRQTSYYVGRDPLDRLLMGDGEAPSLIFARTQNDCAHQSP